MTTREITNAQKKANFEKRCGERDRGGNPQHFLVKAAEVRCRGARERVPASKFSPYVEKKKSRSRTHTSNTEENNSASESDSEEAADASKCLIRLNSSCSTTEANISYSVCCQLRSC